MASGVGASIRMIVLLTLVEGKSAMGLYEQWREEIAAWRVNEAAAHVNRLKPNIVSQSKFLQQLCQQVGYTPPSPRAFPVHLRNMESRIREDAEQRRCAGEKIRKRHEELKAQENNLTASLIAVTWESSVDEVVRIRQQLDTVRHLLSLIPQEGLHDELFLTEAGDSWQQVRERGVARLRAWEAALSQEHRRIKSEIDEMERRDDYTIPTVGHHYLWHELSDVLRAMADANENLQLAGE